MPAANAKNLQEWLKLEPSVARALASEMKSAAGDEEAVDRALENANATIHGYGIEPINGDYHVDNYYFDIVALYVNTGDTYNATVLYETEKEKFLVTTMGDWVERNERRYRIR